MHLNPQEDWAPKTPEDGVLHAFLRVGRQMRARQSGDNIDPSPHLMFALLRLHEPIRLSELAGHCQVDASTVSRQVRSLEEAGLVDRSPDPVDGRAFRIQLSEIGRRQLGESMERRKELLVRAMQGWNQSDIKTFEQLMTRFADGVSRLADDRSTKETR